MPWWQASSFLSSQPRPPGHWQALRPMRQHGVRFAALLSRLLPLFFHRAAKCDVIQVENEDPNCQQVGCRLLHISNWERGPRPPCSGLHHSSTNFIVVGYYFWDISRGLSGMGKCVETYQTDVFVQSIFTRNAHTALGICQELSEPHMLTTLTQEHTPRAGYGHFCIWPPQDFDRLDELRLVPRCSWRDWSVSCISHHVFLMSESFRS